MTVRLPEGTLQPADAVVFAYAAAITLVAVAAGVPEWPGVLLVNAGVCAGAALLIRLHARSGSVILRHAHDWYVAPVIFLWFTQLHAIIGPAYGGRTADDLLIAADRWLFGADPTVWLARTASPVLTEALQIAYASFYLLFFLPGFELSRRNDPGAVRLFLFTIVYGFTLSFLGYFLLPAVGPRFTLHDFSAIDRELPGLVLTPYLRWFVNAGGSVPMQVANDAAMAGAQRDAFPSGHTMMTLVLIVLAFRFRVRTRFVVLGAGTLVILATVYQRYHYVVDLLAGAAFALACLATAGPLWRFLLRRLRPAPPA